MSDSSRKRITVASHKLDDRMLEIVVADTGPGFSGDVLSRLFQPFVTTKATGMGVGLSLSRSIIEDHGGTITAENAPSGGAVFRIQLPSSDKAATRSAG
jgi:two-component system sensor kinase FixL